MTARALTRTLRPIGVAAVALALVAAPAGGAAATPAARPVPAAAPAQDPVGGPLLQQRGVVVQPGPSAEPLPPVIAKAWLLADAETGEVLAAKNAHLALPPASTLKTLTALTVLPRLDPDDTYRARRSDVTAEGGHVGIVQGATYTVEDLLNGMLLASGNDAANAVANANGGMATTVAQMNDEALRLQANDTVARNPSGLDAPGQVSTPYDLALIARAGLARPDFAEYVSRVSADFPGLMPRKPGKKRTTFKIYTQNRLLLHGFRGAIGVKTGYTTNAGRTFVGAARRGDRTLIVALMRITDWTETAAMNALEWGFANADRVSPVGTLADPLDDAAFAAALAERGRTAAGGDATGQPAAPGPGAAEGQAAAAGEPVGGAVAARPAADVGADAGSVDPSVTPVIAALLGLALLGLVAMTAGVLRGRGADRAARDRAGPGDIAAGGAPAGRGGRARGRHSPRHAPAAPAPAAPAPAAVAPAAPTAAAATLPPPTGAPVVAIADPTSDPLRVGLPG